jgi:mono/diheme cytochrome c family protein
MPRLICFRAKNAGTSRPPLAAPPSPHLMPSLPIRWIAIAWLFAACAARGEGQTGEKIYQQQCACCHGISGEGTEDYHPELLVGDRSIEQLAAVIAETMPEDRERKCSPQEARDVATYIYQAFYSPEAQFRNKPARVELSRLTVRQYQNAVADLIGGFRVGGDGRQGRGLTAEYFAARDFRPNAKKLERTDLEVNFDFGEAAPVEEKFEPHVFSIRWHGSVLAPDTGNYEFVVRTEHAARLWVNNKHQPLIDAWVKSGDDTEYRAELRLLGGRTYPLKLEFSKAKQGVDDSDKDKENPKPSAKASISLEWKRPYHTLEVITARNLCVADGPELFVLQVPFPPDDRSVGYERGTAISKAWDESTTEAAIETAAYVAAHANEFASVGAEEVDREARIRQFCHSFAERAFRRPLTDEQKLLYVDRQFAESADSDSAIRRVALLVLKSPRFLYREVGDTAADDGYDIASRLSFGMWDSIPDRELVKAVAYDRPVSREAIAEQLQRMAADPRAHAKLREFLLIWLKVSQPPNISKDPPKFADFTPEIVSDLRTSLELSLDDVLSSQPADFRELLLTNEIFLSGRLAPIYGVELPDGAAFQKVRCQPEQRSGLVSHPYLLACFAYMNASSPIHRGVFISRSLLGRALRPPPEAVAPLPLELHAEMSTRERVSLQTQPEACQTCHSMINPLGFALEEFDAIGRYREADKDRPIDASGSYVTQSGEEARFNGVDELANFLATSEETRAAFVLQLFRHMVKQPIRAYGPEQFQKLQQAFAENDFNIRKLAAEIVAASAFPPQ